jgi:hypothetical protein
MRGPVLWYVHHQGAGHWRRALAVVRRLTREVVLISSAEPPGPLPEHARWVRLADDFPLDPGRTPARVEAGGTLHWAPPHHRGLLDRHGAILAEAAQLRPSLAIVDVSVEVAVLLRASGVPVIAVRLPGQRTDFAHRLGFDLADEVVMPVPAHWGLQTGLARTVSVGLVSGLVTGPVPARFGTGRIPGQPQEPGSPDRSADGPVVIVVGQGGTRIDPAVCVRIASEVPERKVRVMGLDHPLEMSLSTTPNLTFLGRIPDPSHELAAACTVVANCGLGALADTVSARRPLVVLPEDRPFGEQRASASALRSNNEAVVLDYLPASGGWRTAIEAAIFLGPPPLVADGAARFAERIEQRAVSEDALRNPSLDAFLRPKLRRSTDRRRHHDRRRPDRAESMNVPTGPNR